MRHFRSLLFLFTICLLHPATMRAQEILTGITQNSILVKAYNPNAPKGTRDISVRLPFVEDFSNYTGYPNSELWLDRKCFVNNTFAIVPPSIGVATFDALDENGKIYAHADRSTFPADTLTSVCIRLDSNFTQHRPMRISDSIYFSFYYQPGGGCSGTPPVGWERIGDAPEHDDALVLEFGYATGNMVFQGYEYGEYILGEGEYHIAGDTIENPFIPGTYYIFESNAFAGETILIPADSIFGPEYVWNEVWSTDGCSLDSWLAQNPLDYFKQVLIPITDEQYLRDNFQFRFRNYASLDLDSWSGNNIVGWASNCDQWNIDYIRMDINRNAEDFYPSDVAFVSPTTSALALYQSMPWHQYRSSDMAENFHNQLSNLSNDTRNVGYQYSVVKQPGGTVYQSVINYMNATPYYDSGLHTYAPHAEPGVGFEYTYDGADSAMFRITHVFKMEGTGDENRHNDTCVFEQKFYNYYAYDDGTAEAGYSLLSTMSNPESYLAVQFTLAEPDTLRCVRMWFNSVLNDENFGNFTLMVWDDDNGLPGDVIYSLPAQLPAHAADYLNFVSYYPEEPIPVEGTFYVGFLQNHNIQLNLGFDQNNDARGHFFYSVANEWKDSYYKGAPMIRPVVGKYFDYTGIADRKTTEVRLYPNPTTGMLYISTDEDLQNPDYQIIDIYGRLLEQGHAEGNALDLSRQKPGVYFIRLLKDNRILSTEKIIKQ